MTENSKELFSYKGFPLVRNEDTIYYGNIADEYVVMIQIVEKKKIGDIEVASRLKLYKMSTDESKNPIERISQTSEKSSLYDALDIANIWLSRAASA